MLFASLLSAFLGCILGMSWSVDFMKGVIFVPEIAGTVSHFPYSAKLSQPGSLLFLILSFHHEKSYSLSCRVKSIKHNMESRRRSLLSSYSQTLNLVFPSKTQLYHFLHWSLHLWIGDIRSEGRAGWGCYSSFLYFKNYMVCTFITSCTNFISIKLKITLALNMKMLHTQYKKFT